MDYAPSKTWLSLLLLGSALTVCGCDNSGDEGTSNDSGTDSADPQDTDETSGDTEDTDATVGDSDAVGETEDGSDTEGPEPDGADLFACGLPLACPEIFVHLGPEPADAVSCVADLTVSRGPGAFDIHDVPGPGTFEGETLSIVRADGSVVRQSRSRSCADICTLSEQPWELGEVEACSLSVDIARYEECRDEDLPCEIWTIDNCQPAADFGCEEAEAALDEEPPPTVACGDETCSPDSVCVQETLDCVCDPRTNEFDFVSPPPACASLPAACEGLEAGEQLTCLAADLCETGANEFDSLEQGQLTCGQAPTDCFGPC